MTDLLPLADCRVLHLGEHGAADVCARILQHLGAQIVRSFADSPIGPSATAYDLVITGGGDVGAPEHAAARPTLSAHGGVVVAVRASGHRRRGDGDSGARDVPVGFPPDVVDALIGAHAAVAGLAALRFWRKSGTGPSEGLQVEVAAADVVVSCLGQELARAVCPLGHQATAADAGAPVGLQVCACADGYVGVGPLGDDDAALLASLIGADAPMTEGDAGGGRLAVEALTSWLRDRSRAEIVEEAQLWRIPVVPVLTPDEVRRDAQSVARQVWLTDDPDDWTVRSPFRLSRAGARPSRERLRPDVAGMAAPVSQHAPPDDLPGATITSGRSQSSPLADVVVLDLGMVWAGPYCGRLLAGLGAEVIKVEGPARPDGTRPGPDAACQGVFADLNGGKASLVLDLRQPAGRETFLRLVSQADILVESFSPRVMTNLSLEYSMLAEINPALLIVSMPAFGATGPWAGYVAYGSGLELATGLAGRSDDGQPVPTSVAYLDYLAGCYAAIGILAALLARDRTGQGAHLEVAQREVAAQVLAARAGTVTQSRSIGVDAATLADSSVLHERVLRARPSTGERAQLEDGAPCSHLVRLPFRFEGSTAPVDQLLHAGPPFGGSSRSVLMRRACLTADEVDSLIRSGIVVAGAERPTAVGAVG